MDALTYVTEQTCPTKPFQYLLSGYAGRNIMLQKPEYVISMLYLHLQDWAIYIDATLNTLTYPG